MPAGDQQQQIGRLQALGQADGQRVRLQMIDGHERQLVHQRHRLGRDDAHQQPADQSRPGRHRHRHRDLVEADARLAHRLGDDLVEAFHVRAGGDLRHHAAVAAVLLPLRAHDVGQDAPASRPARAQPRPRPSRRSSSRCRAPALARVRWDGCIHVGVGLHQRPDGRHKRASPSVSGHRLAPEERALASIDNPHRHARLAAGAGAGPRGARAAGGRARARTLARSRCAPSRPPATASRTGRSPRPAARVSSPRRSRRRCWPARSTSPCIP